MSPLHNHFELLGWSETQVMQRFVLIGMVSALVGISLALTIDDAQEAWMAVERPAVTVER
jgi:phospho-N-acetylmuramoyl-pentapeptide-transferase